MTSHCRKRTVQALSLAILTVTAIGTATARDLMKEFDFATFEATPQTVAKEYVEAKSQKTGTFSKKESITGVKKVGVTGFQVVFSEVTAEQTNGSTWKGITQGNFSDNRWELAVRNMTLELRQQITEALYDDFKSQLSNAGFEVVPQETISASGPYQRLVATTTASNDVLNKTQRSARYGKNQVWSVVPEGFPIEKVDLNADIFAGAKPGFMTGVQQMTNGFAQNGKTGDLSEAYQEFKDFTPVSVTYFVDFKKLKAIGGLLPTNPFHSSAKDSLFGLSVSPGSYVRFYTGMDDDGNRWEQKYASARQLNFILKQPVQSTEPVGEVKFEHENVGAQAVGVVANMAFRSMGMSGLKPARRVREYELMVNPDSYNSQASKVLQAVNTMMVNMIRDEANVTAQAAPAQE